jgi:hypothetical protein
MSFAAERANRAAKPVTPQRFTSHFPRREVLMLRSTALLLLLILCSSAASAQTTAPLFRHISLGKFGHITLGEAFVQADSIGIPAGERTYRLRPGTFGRAEEIRVVLSSRGAINEIHFVYPPSDASYDRQLQSATRMLGSPVIEASDTLVIARWEDERTTLELGRRTSSEGVEVFTVMKDRPEAAP